MGSAPLADGGRPAEAVVAFRTSLFRRYPGTVVYLYPAAANFTPPAPTVALGPLSKKPTFTGTIGDDITVFGFALQPDALATHWVVLEEPPAGYRFTQTPTAPPADHPGVADDQASNFAVQHFSLPVRVLIGPLRDKGGNGDDVG